MKVGILCCGLLLAGACTKKEDEGHYSSDTGTLRTTGTDNDGKVSFGDKRFVKGALELGTKEVRLAEYPVNRATSTAIRDFAKMMVDDHTKSNDELKMLAMNKNIEGDEVADAEDDARDKIDNWSKKSGSEFDKAFIEQMVRDHKKAVRHFEDAAEDADDAEIRAFAAKHLSTLRMHLEKAQMLENDLKGRNVTKDNNVTKDKNKEVY